MSVRVNENIINLKMMRTKKEKNIIFIKEVR